jgi:hypothetical protein
MTIYRGYDIKAHPEGGFTWTDERGFEHFALDDRRVGYETEDKAQDAIDAYKRHMRNAGAG